MLNTENDARKKANGQKKAPTERKVSRPLSVNKISGEVSAGGRSANKALNPGMVSRDAKTAAEPKKKPVMTGYEEARLIMEAVGFDIISGEFLSEEDERRHRPSAQTAEVPDDGSSSARGPIAEFARKQRVEEGKKEKPSFFGKKKEKSSAEEARIRLAACLETEGSGGLKKN